MPRRGFFRGGGGGEKKSAKKLNKKLAQQQEQIYQQQQQRPPQLSSANNESEPPLGLDGPRQTAPFHSQSRAYEARVNGVQIQPSSTQLTAQQVAAAGALVGDYVDRNQHHDDHNFPHRQHQTQPPTPYRPSLPFHQHYEDKSHILPRMPHDTPHHQNQPQSSTTDLPTDRFQQHREDNARGHQSAPRVPYDGQGSFASQPEALTQYPPSLLHHNGTPNPRQYNIPTQNQMVDNAVDEIWRCETDDFRSASHAIQMLRLAIVADWESHQSLESENDETIGPRNFSYDPSDTFLSLQGATLRFHECFESIKAERDADQSAQRHALQAGDDITVNTQRSSLNGVEWELTEQAAWEVWEEAVRASAALTHACVGPAWRRQLRLRRQLISESEMRLLHQPHLQYRSRFTDTMSVGAMSVGSSVGGGSSFVSMVSNPQSSVRRIPAADLPAWQPPTDILDMISFPIPEVLPAAMIRFAANVIVTSIPPLRTQQTKIFWGSQKGVREVLGQHLQDERRWLRRRKRLGDTQRDLAFGLFCGGSESNAEGNHGENKWSIPGSHTPVALMIHSWLETCLSWPIPRETEDGLIPYHFEEPKGIYDESPCGPPPAEILLPSGLPEGGTCELRRRKFSFWGDLVENSSFDWWYTLRVLRDCSDLMSAGWTPSSIIGDEIILTLVSIAESGISHLDGDNYFLRETPVEQIRKERLVACSCASESLVCLKTLASREVLPHAALQPLVAVLCQLISMSGTTINSASGAVQEDDALFEKEILAQRTYVASNSASLLWLMLSAESTSCPTTDALLDVIDLDLSVEVTDENRAQVEECVKRGSGGIRALSAAMWGDPPSVKGVPSLRFFWEPVIDLVGLVASTFFQDHGDAPNTKFDIAGRTTSVIFVSEQTASNNSPFLTIVLEIVLALQRLVDSEMVFGSGDLCATEWESFVTAIDIGITPWLIQQGNGSALAHKIRFEAISICSRLTGFLERCCSMPSSGFHPIVDDDAREYFHLFCLRKSAPLLQEVYSFANPTSHPAIVGDGATKLALAVIKSWCAPSLLPFKEGDWSRRASNVLSEAFLIPKSQLMGDSRYIGGYLHHPLVRIEALKSLVDDESIDIDDSVSTSTPASMVSMRSGNNPPPVLSLFTLTKNLRELHLVLVNSILLPRLEEALSSTKTILEKTDCQPNHNTAKTPSAECFDIIEKEFLLRRFAVKMLGMLFRSRTGESERRHNFIELLQHVATSTPYDVSDWVRHRERGDSSLASGPISPTRFLREEIASLRFECMRQIELCLGACFTSLPHTHGNVPGILKALCNTAHFYSIECQGDAELTYPVADRLLMTLASILPLARLSCARNGQGILMSRQHVTRIVPADILSVLSVGELLHDISPLDETLPIVSEENVYNTSDHGDIAPFVYVKQHHAGEKEDSKSQVFESRQSESSKKETRRRHSRRHDTLIMNGKQGTIVDFEPVAATMKLVLCAVSNSLSSRHDGGTNLIFDRTITPSSLVRLPSILCTISYSVLSLFLSHGMAFPGMDDMLWLNINSPSDRCDSEAEDELVSRSQAVSDFAGVLGHLIASHNDDEENNTQLLSRRVCTVLVQLSNSKCRNVVQHACCGLISILSSLRHAFGKRETKCCNCYDTEISAIMVSFLKGIISKLRIEPTSLVLIPLIDAMREVFICSRSVFEFPVSLRRKAFLLLFQPICEQWEVQVVAHQCAVAIINTMTPGEASLMLFFVIGPQKRTLKAHRTQPLLIDLLRYRLITVRSLNSNIRSEEGCCKPSKVHSRLAHEAASLETFPVDLDNLGRPKSSAWKVGNSILSLRLGSKDSLYRGWVEIVIRSPCSRTRRLVKWKDLGVTELPVSLLPFEEEPSEQAEMEDGLLFKITSVQQTDKMTQSQFLESDESLNVLARAKLSIARFDSLIDVPNSISSRNAADGASLQEHSGKIDANVKPDKSKTSVYLTPLPHYSKSVFGEMRNDVEKTITANSSLGSLMTRSRSDGNLVIRPRSEPGLSHEQKGNVYSWLQNATCRDDVHTGLIHELEKNGFSRLALGVPDTLITNASYPDLFVHEKLKPYTVDANFCRAISILDRVTPFQTHRVGLLYGGPFSTKKNTRNSKVSTNHNGGDDFLMSTQASTDFWEFAKELGELVPVRHCRYFSGGLDTSESLSDGFFAFVWFGCHGGSCEVDSMVFFHTVTLMPDRLTNRKRHVGNDVVHIVYGLDIDTLDVDHQRLAISGHFGFITIYVISLVHVPLYKVSAHLKAGLDERICSALDHLVGSWLISKKVGAHFVRNLAMQSDVICQSMIEDKLGLVLNTEDRDRRIRDTERHLAEKIP